jgi:nucleotide-binding universal stress UspA family protein
MSGPVLVGLDGSDGARNALRWAASFARATERELYVAHAWQHGGQLEDGALDDFRCSDPAQLEADVEERLLRIAADELGDGRVTAAVALRGGVADALARHADRRDASLVVVGARGLGAARRLLLGSVARTLVEYPSCPVAVVPRSTPVPEDQGAAWTILVGVDGSASASRAVRWARDVAARCGAEVVTIHALEPPSGDPSAAVLACLREEAEYRIEEEWSAPLRHAGVRYRTLVEEGDPRHVLETAALSSRPVSLVAGSRGLSGMTRRMLGSVSDHAVRNLKWPVVVVPRPCETTVAGGHGSG